MVWRSCCEEVKTSLLQKSPTTILEWSSGGVGHFLEKSDLASDDLQKPRWQNNESDGDSNEPKSGGLGQKQQSMSTVTSRSLERWESLHIISRHSNTANTHWQQMSAWTRMCLVFSVFSHWPSFLFFPFSSSFFPFFPVELPQSGESAKIPSGISWHSVLQMVGSFQTSAMFDDRTPFSLLIFINHSTNWKWSSCCLLHQHELTLQSLGTPSVRMK